MASLRSSAAVGLAGSTNPGDEEKKPRPDLPSPPVRRSSGSPSYAVVTMAPFTNDGRVFRSLLDRHAASARTSSGSGNVLADISVTISRRAYGRKEGNVGRRHTRPLG